MSVDQVTKYFKQDHRTLYDIAQMLNVPLDTVRRIALETKIIGHRVKEFCKKNKGKTVLVFDLETTGLPKTKGFNKFFPYDQNDSYDSSRIIQLAYCTFQLGDTVETERINSFYRAPDNFTISPESFRIHGISHEKLVQDGIQLQEILDSGFFQALQDCDFIISHNIQFDFNILCNELYRMEKDIPKDWKRKLACTCRMTDFTKLKVLYEAIVDKDTTLPFHDASTDVLALCRILNNLSIE